MFDNKPQDQITAEFMKRRRRQIWACALAAGFVPMWSAVGTGPCFALSVSLPFATLVLLMLLPVVAVGIAMLWFTVVNWRCPACNKSLWPEPPLRHCMKCGASVPRDTFYGTCPSCKQTKAAWFSMGFCSECGTRLR